MRPSRVYSEERNAPHSAVGCTQRTRTHCEKERNKVGKSSHAPNSAERRNSQVETMNQINELKPVDTKKESHQLTSNRSPSHCKVT